MKFTYFKKKNYSKLRIKLKQISMRKLLSVKQFQGKKIYNSCKISQIVCYSINFLVVDKTPREKNLNHILVFTISFAIDLRL